MITYHATQMNTHEIKQKLSFINTVFVILTQLIEKTNHLGTFFEM